MPNGKKGKGGKGARKLKKGSGGSAIGKSAGVSGGGDDDIDAIVASLDKEKSDAEAARLAKAEEQRRASEAAAKHRAEQAERQRKADAEELQRLSEGVKALADPADATAAEKLQLEAIRRAAAAARDGKNLPELRKQTMAFKRRVGEIEASKLEVQRLRGELAKQADPDGLSAAEGKLLGPIRDKIRSALDEHQDGEAAKGIEALAKAIQQVHKDRRAAAAKDFADALDAARADAAKAAGVKGADLEFFDHFVDDCSDRLGSGDPVKIRAAIGDIAAVAAKVKRLGAARAGNKVGVGKVQLSGSPAQATILRNPTTGYYIKIDANRPGAGVGDEIEFVYTVEDPLNAQRAEIIAVTKAAATDYSQLIDFATATYDYAGSADKHFYDGYLPFRKLGDIRQFLIDHRAGVQKTSTAGQYRLPTGSNATGQRPLDAIIFDYDHGTNTVHVFHVQ